MAHQYIGIGEEAGDHSGSSLRAGAQIIDENFAELYTEYEQNFVLTTDLEFIFTTDLNLVVTSGA